METEDQQDKSEDGSDSQGITPFLPIVLAVMFVLYPLSIGPAVYVSNKVRVRPIRKALKVVYTPLILVQYVADDTIVSEALDRYVEFWEGL